ncbi:MAG: hypothetical protein WEA61_00405 [Anaerolineales bacterium]
MSNPLILHLATDLFFNPSITAAVEALSYSIKAMDRYLDTAEFLKIVRQENPALIILDLNSSLPWIEWLPAAKANKETKALPWLAYGSHMNPRRLAAARRAGADKVVPKSQFSAELDQLIQAMAAK